MKSTGKIKSTQTRGARFVLNGHHNTSSVNAMMNRLNWPSLQPRRRTARLATLRKIKKNLVYTEYLPALTLQPLPDLHCSIEATTSDSNNHSAAHSTDSFHSSPEQLKNGTSSLNGLLNKRQLHFFSYMAK